MTICLARTGPRNDPVPEGRVVVRRRSARHAVGHEHGDIVGALVPVHGDHVEAGVHHVLPLGVGVLGEHGVGGDEAKGGGVQHLHGRGDHA